MLRCYWLCCHITSCLNFKPRLQRPIAQLPDLTSELSFIFLSSNWLIIYFSQVFFQHKFPIQEICFYLMQPSMNQALHITHEQLESEYYSVMLRFETFQCYFRFLQFFEKHFELLLLFQYPLIFEPVKGGNIIRHSFLGKLKESWENQARLFKDERELQITLVAVTWGSFQSPKNYDCMMFNAHFIASIGR